MSFATWCESLVARLPFGLSRLVAPSLVGFAVINGGAFAVDLTVVTVVHGGLGLPVAAAVTTGYAVAFCLAFVLNKLLNFRSHGPVGPETARYLVVVVTNFVVLLLGVTTLLASVGVQYQVARLVAGGCEGLFTYAAMRWFVFSPSPARPPR
jgi:putative flippase GtrA